MIAETYMHYCLALAKQARDTVKLNPMVGAVIVANNRIIGKGNHQYFGGPHAEVNALENVAESDWHLLKESTLYVNLEPCSHYGKTPPCASLLADSPIKKIVIAMQDPNEMVAGKGIKILKDAGKTVRVGVLEKEAAKLNEAFVHHIVNKRPFVVLKWAQNQNGFMAIKNEPVWISNTLSMRFVHKLRSQTDAILVGANTVLIDNPQLTNRYYSGKQPLRLVIDANNKTVPTSRIYSNDNNWNKFTFTANHENDIALKNNDSIVQQVMEYCYKMGKISLLVEGGPTTLQHFINEGIWDKIICIEGQKHIENGIASPSFTGNLIETQQLGDNVIKTFSCK